MACSHSLLFPSWKKSAVVRAFHAVPVRKNLLQCGLLQGLQQNLCSSAWKTSSPSFFSHLGVPFAVSHSLFFYPPLSIQHFLPFLKYTFPEVPPSWMLGSAVPSSGPVGDSWYHLYLPQGIPDLSSQNLLLQHPHPVTKTLLQTAITGVLWCLSAGRSVAQHILFPSGYLL